MLNQPLGTYEQAPWASKGGPWNIMDLFAGFLVLLSTFPILKTPEFEKLSYCR